jgi:hypothetical protein
MQTKKKTRVTSIVGRKNNGDEIENLIGTVSPSIAPQGPSTIQSKNDEIENLIGTVSPSIAPQGPSTIQSKNEEIKKEASIGKAIAKRIQSKSWKGKQDGRQFVVGNDTGILAWLIPLFCAFFGCEDVGYRKNVTIWNFPPDVDNPKKKHHVMIQTFKQLDGKYVMIDMFDDKTQAKKIMLIKAWLEALGYRYTYLMGTDQKISGDPDKLAALLFEKRLAVLDAKSGNYPVFKVPLTYRDAGLPYGQTNLVGEIK